MSKKQQKPILEEPYEVLTPEDTELKDETPKEHTGIKYYRVRRSSPYALQIIEFQDGVEKVVKEDATAIIMAKLGEMFIKQARGN